MKKSLISPLKGINGIFLICLFFSFTTNAQQKLSIKLYDEDTLHKAKAIIMTDSAGEQKPVAEAEVHFYIKRLFSLLPVQEDASTTDENGEAIIDFPKTFPGDKAGQLTIVARVEGEEDTLSAEQTIDWGVPFKDEHHSQRLLSASRANAPITLIIVSNAIILSVWGIIAYIVLQLFKIKRKSKLISNN